MGFLNESDQAVIERFLDSLWMEKGLSDNTLSSYRRDLCIFTRWLVAKRRILLEVTRQDILQYLSHRLDVGITARSTARLLATLRGLYRYLLRESRIAEDPTLTVENPKLGRSLPHTLTEQDVEKLLQVPDVSTAIGCRDRAMLEVLYACGLRVSELVKLNVTNVNLRQGVIRIVGKGNKERLIPMGEEAILWISQFIKEARGDLLKKSLSVEVLFPSNRGRRMTRQAFWYRIKEHARKAAIKRKVSPHTLRHAFATHLLNHGADLRVVQLLLGHRDLSSTQIYTHVADHRMKELHRAHHPRG